jgi:hypothetical protein
LLPLRVGLQNDALEKHLAFTNYTILSLSKDDLTGQDAALSGTRPSGGQDITSSSTGISNVRSKFENMIQLAMQTTISTRSPSVGTCLQHSAQVGSEILPTSNISSTA